MSKWLDISTFIDQNRVHANKQPKQNNAIIYIAILTEQAWPIKDLQSFYEKRHIDVLTER